MKAQQPRPLVGVLLEKLAPKIRAKVIMEPDWNIVGQIIFRNGRKRYFRYSSLDLNPLGASMLAKDKDYANFFMDRMGYPTILGKTFYSKSWAKAINSKRNIDAAYVYAKKLGWPVIVKPNNGQQGKGVVLVYTKQQFYRAMRDIFTHDPVALVQRFVKGQDYRIVVLDGEVIAAYERTPLSVTGNGKAAIRELLAHKQKAFKGSSRDIKIDLKDPRIIEKLKRDRLDLKSVPAKAECVFLLDNANMSSGGEAVEVTNSIHPDFKKLAISLTKDMGLRLCGVDLMVEGSISEKPSKYWVLEVNASPGLDHYAKLGPSQQKTVERLYLKALKLMEASS